MREKPKTKPNNERRPYLRMLLVGLFLAFMVMCVAPVALVMLTPAINSLDGGQCAAALPEIDILSSPEKIVAIPEQIDADLIPINAGNAMKVQEITHFGRGTIYDAVWNKEGDLLVLTSTGLWRHSKTHLFDAPELLWTQSSVFYTPVLSPDGSRIALWMSNPNPIAVFDTVTGEYQRMHTASDIEFGPDRLEFSPDGKLLAMSDQENMTIWNIAANKKVLSFPKVTDYIEDIAFSPDSALLAVVGTDYQRQGDQNTPKIRVWNLGNGKQTLEITPTGDIYGVAFHPDGNRLVGVVSSSVTADVNRHVESWRLSSGEPIRTELLQAEDVPIVYSFDGRYAAFGGSVYDVQTAKLVMSEPPRGSFHVIFSPDNRWLALVDHPNNNRLYISSLEHPADIQPITAYAEDHNFKRIEFRSNTEIAGYPYPGELMLHGGTKYPASDRITVSPDRKRFTLLERRFAFNEDMVVRLCETASGSQLAFLHTKNIPVFSHSGQYLVTVGECNVLEVRDGAAAKLLRTFGPCNRLDLIQSMTFSPDDTVLALTRSTGMIELIQFDTGQTVETLHENDWIIGGLAFNDTGTLLASSSQDGTIRLWGVPSNK